MSSPSTPHVSFIINTDLPSAHDLIERLGGLEPDDSRSKGERTKRGPARGYPNTFLAFESPLTPDVNANVVAQIRAVLDRIEPIRERILDLKQYCASEGIYFRPRITYFHFVPFATVAWLELSQDDLKRIASFGADLNAEYIWRADSTDPAVEWDEDPDHGFFDKDHWHWIHQPRESS
jgi:hypothetical protein